MKHLLATSAAFSAYCFLIVVSDIPDESLPTKCHVCKHLVQEISHGLAESGKTHDVLQIGQHFQGGIKKIPYRQSETRLTEAIEDACSNVLDYKVHKDRPDALRYEKVQSVTFNTLNDLRKRGVKVDLGFPYEMWDSPDAEVERLRQKCEYMAEKHEDDIIEWYWKHQHENLTNWLCAERVLDPDEDGCLNETKAIEEFEKEKKEKEKKDKEMKEKEGDGNDIQHLIREQAEEQVRAQYRESGKERDRVRQKVEDATEDEKDKKRKRRKKSKKSNSRKDKPLRKRRDRDQDRYEDEDGQSKIQRLIQEQAEEQARGHYREGGRERRRGRDRRDRDERKRRKLRHQNLDDEDEYLRKRYQLRDEF